MNDDYSFYTDATRRRFMQGAGSLVALGSMPAFMTANAVALQSSLAGLQQQQGLVLFRQRHRHSVVFAEALARTGLQMAALTDDPVRQWRDGLGATVAQGGITLAGLTNWADYLLVGDLAREARKRVLLEVQHPVAQPGREDWAQRLADSFLQLPITGDHTAIAAFVSDQTKAQRPIKPGEPTLFSWIIA